MIQAITAALKALAAALGIIEKRQADANTPEMKARAEAQARTDAESKDVEAIQKRDLERLRNESSE